jgi:hypothetical protein
MNTALFSKETSDLKLRRRSLNYNYLTTGGKGRYCNGSFLLINYFGRSFFACRQLDWSTLRSAAGVKSPPAEAVREGVLVRSTCGIAATCSRRDHVRGYPQIRDAAYRVSMCTLAILSCISGSRIQLWQQLLTLVCTHRPPDFLQGVSAQHSSMKKMRMITPGR